VRTPRPLPKLPEQFSAGEALAIGVPKKRLYASDLDRSLHGVRHSGAVTPTLLERCRMLLLRVPERSFFSHATAALLWGAPLPFHMEQDERLHVGVPSPSPRLHSRSIAGHRMDIEDGDVTTWGDLPLTTPARTWFDLASSLSLGDLVAVGDYFVHHAAPLTDREELARVLAHGDGLRGIRRAREAIGLLSERAESRPESRLRVLIATSNLPMPEINRTLVDTTTGKRVRPDFLFAEHRAILEYQGDYHRSRNQWRKDMSRRSRLEAQGWRIMELNADDLIDPAELVSRIRALLKRR